MILHALRDFYERMREDPAAGIPEYGFSVEKIHFTLVLDKNGNCVGVDDEREVKKNRKLPKQLHVPQAVKRSSDIAANFLWDNTGYLLGADDKGKSDRAAEMFDKSKTLHHNIGDRIKNPGMHAVLRFLDKWNPSAAPMLKYWDEMVGKHVTFRLDGERKYVHQHVAIKEAWIEYVNSKKDAPGAPCLVLGRKLPIARLHPPIKGVRGAQSSGGNIVGFNLESFCSYGKSQGYNAPVSEEASFAYASALNALLRRDDRRVQIGDATTVFWAEKESPLEGLFAQIFSPRAEDTSAASDVRNFLEAVREGKKPKDIDIRTKFYILGLSPNAGRLSVRFWYAGTVGELSDRIGKHYHDISIASNRAADRQFPGMWQILVQTAVQGKTKNIHPLLAGELMRSILTGANYPESLLAILIGRIRAGEELNYLRAAMIRGILRRNHKKEISMSWNTNNKDTAYLLGGLFAILEKTQQDAGNKTIREKYFRAASATPKIAFSVLMPLAQHHIAKAAYGSENDRRIAELMESIEEFPSYLTLQQQGLFSIGYYHMRNKIWKDIIEASAAKKAGPDK